MMDVVGSISAKLIQLRIRGRDLMSIYVALDQAYGPTFPSTSKAYTTTDVDGLCFQPKALLIMDGNKSATIGVSANKQAFSWCTSTSDEITARVNVQVNNTTYNGNFNTSQMNDGMGSPSSLSSFNSLGYTLSGMVADATISQWHMALGGSDLQAYAGIFTVPASGTGIAVTGVGFQPDLILTMGAYDSFVAGEVFSFGMATGAASQVATSQCQRQGVRYANEFYDGQFATSYRPNFFTPTNPEYNFRVSLASMTSDGFTYNVTANTASGHGYDTRVPFLALKCPTAQFKVGIAQQPTTPGDQAISGLGFRPGAGFFASTDRVVSTGTGAGGDTGPWGATSVGFTSESKSASTAMAGKYVSSAHRNAQRLLSTSVIQALNFDGSGVAIENARATLKSFDSSGFTLNWSAADAVARYYAYCVFQAEKAPPCSGKLTSFDQLVFPQ